MSLVCANCGIPIRWQPTLIDDKAYCCLGCAAGGPCQCDYDHLPMPGDRVSIVVRHEQFVQIQSADLSGWVYEFKMTRSEENGQDYRY